MKNYQKGFAPLIIILIIAALAIGGGVYYVQKNKNSEPYHVPGALHTETSTDTQTNVKGNIGPDYTPSSIDTSKWQLYTNSDYGVTFKYPVTFAVMQTEKSSRKLDVTIKPNYPTDDNMRFTVDTSVGSSGGNCGLIGKTTIGMNIPATKRSCSTPGLTSTAYEVILDNNTSLYISINISSNSKHTDSSNDYFNSILSTIDVKNKQSQSSDWKTYTNAQYGFLAKYPATWIYREINDNPNKQMIVFYEKSDPNSSNGWTITIYKKSYKTSATFLSNLTTLFKDNLQKSSTTINGNTAVRVDITEADVHGTHIFFEKGDFLYDISGSGKNYYKDTLFVDFYNSFKFTN
jgi:hypothetical protein